MMSCWEVWLWLIFYCLFFRSRPRRNWKKILWLFTLFQDNSSRRWTRWTKLKSKRTSWMIICLQILFIDMLENLVFGQNLICNCYLCLMRIKCEKNDVEFHLAHWHRINMIILYCNVCHSPGMALLHFLLWQLFRTLFYQRYKVRVAVGSQVMLRLGLGLDIVFVPGLKL